MDDEPQRRGRTTSLADFSDDLATYLDANDEASEANSWKDGNNNSSSNNDDERILEILSVVNNKKERTDGTAEPAALAEALVALQEFPAASLLRAKALPSLVRLLQTTTATLVDSSEDETVLASTIALLKVLVEEQCADLPYIMHNPSETALVDFGITDADQLVERLTRILKQTSSSNYEISAQVDGSILYCLYSFVAYGGLKIANPKTLRSILSSMKYHRRDDLLQYHASRLLMVILDQDLSALESLTAAIKVLPNALKRVHGWTTTTTGDPEPVVFALRSTLMLVVGNDKAKEYFCGSHWRKTVAIVCLEIISVASFGTLLHCALNLLAVAIEDSKDLKTLVVHSNHRPVLAQLLKTYKKNDILVMDILRIYSSLLHGNPVPGAGTMIGFDGDFIRIILKVINYYRRIQDDHTAKVASCILIDMALYNPALCDELVRRKGSLNDIQILPPYEAQWLLHVISQVASNQQVRSVALNEIETRQVYRNKHA